MDGYRIDPGRFTAVLEQANITARELAERVGCHPRHLRKFRVAGPDGRAPAEPSRELADAILAALSARLERTVAVDEIAEAVPSRWRTAS